MNPILLSATEFCHLVDIEVKRFEQRRIRERAKLDLGDVSMEDPDFVAMPVVPTEPGKHGRFDAIDVIRLRSVIILERGGMSFNEGCKFIRQSGTTGYLGHIGPEDYLAARWIELNGDIRHVSGNAYVLARAMPAIPLFATKLNITAVADQVAERAAALPKPLGIRHGHFIALEGANDR